MDEIDVSDIPGAQLLAALYNNATAMGAGVLQARREPMTIEQAQALIDGETAETDYDGAKARDRAPGKPAHFDYLYGRPMKLTINGKTLRVWGYDRDHGQGACQRVADSIRGSAPRPSRGSQPQHSTTTETP